ncbi:hypothetical protein LTR20_009315 [Exophiala xenobiotica]|nr:hypothetical protein LTS13_009736 [Exophiala xenobiotica]KAK5408216.1 hypothetical protein LTR90_009672 [Exophiala xenobiotica]KAK5456374.1 hypothetical protein LTR20_009315 [Exophiala xenobiotica]KAK5472276.1 hypothetical protein LTR26_010402 [Exophiala xenobiotica]KAK5480876.1 hypothetical protein LTR83_009948 [Exophiala xenobiotica]
MSSSMELTTRTDLSLLYRVLRTQIRPLRPRLVKPGKEAPPGSQRLKPPAAQKFKRGCEVLESQREDVWEYTFRHTSQSHQGDLNTQEKINRRKTPYRVYYFCGGGFQSPPSSEHWLFLTKLAKDLARQGQEAKKRHREVVITVVSHPLAPASPAAETLPILRRWLTSTLDDASREGETVTLAGDSSGGNIALSLGLWAVQHYYLPPPTTTTTISTASPLVSVLVICPAVDLRNINPGIAEADRHDPVLTVGLTSQVAQAWTGNVASKHTKTAPRRLVDLEDPDVSPLLNEDVVFEEVKDQGVSIHGVVGTHDVLAPDALELMRKCERLGVKGKWLVWEGQMHCFPLAGVGDIIGLREGKEGRRWVEEVLREDACGM